MKINKLKNRGIGKKAEAVILAALIAASPFLSPVHTFAADDEIKYEAGEGGGAEVYTPPSGKNTKEIDSIASGNGDHNCRNYLKIKSSTIYRVVGHQVPGSDLEVQYYEEPWGCHWYECQYEGCKLCYKTEAAAADKANALTAGLYRCPRTGSVTPTGRDSSGRTIWPDVHSIHRTGDYVTNPTSASGYVTGKAQCMWSAGSQTWSCPVCGWSASWKKPALPQTLQNMSSWYNAKWRGSELSFENGASGPDFGGGTGTTIIPKSSNTTWAIKNENDMNSVLGIMNNKTNATWNNTWKTEPSQKYHYHLCTDCGSVDNVNPGCDKGVCSGKVCSVCKYNYGANYGWHAASTSYADAKQGSVKCSTCGGAIVSFSDTTATYLGNNKYRVYTTITSWDKKTFGTIQDVYNAFGMHAGNGNSPTPLVTNPYTGGSGIYKKIVGNTIKGEAILDMSRWTDGAAAWNNERGGRHTGIGCTWYWAVVTGGKRASWISTTSAADSRVTTTLYVDKEAPTINGATTNWIQPAGATSGSYNTKGVLSVNFNDNWKYGPNTVRFCLYDSAGQAVCPITYCESIHGSGYTDANQGPYSNFTGKTDLTMEAKAGEQYTLKVWDACNNMRETKIAISSNIDSKPPTPAATAYETSKEWSRTKKVTVKCTESGAGNIQIAFNNTGDANVGYTGTKVTKNGNTYSAEYVFHGKLSGKLDGTIYYKDAAGNVSTSKITIYNLDEEKPVMQSASFTNKKNSYNEVYGWQLSATATDNNGSADKDKNGNAVNLMKYAVTKDPKAPPAFKFTKLDDIVITRSGKYYIWAIDPMGNISSNYKEQILEPDVLYNGKKIGELEYNGKEVDSIFYRYPGGPLRGIRLRL